MRKYGILLLVPVIILAFWLGSIWPIPESKVQVEKGIALPVYGQIPDFQLVNYDNNPFTLGDLEGSPWVSSFIFSRCSGPCPLMTAHMKSLQEKLKGKNIKFVSFTVDPGYDSPLVLQSYSEKYDPQPGWFFLTGDKEIIYKLSKQHFLLGVSDENADRDDEHMIYHSTRFALMDGNHQIRGYYDSRDPKELERLMEEFEVMVKS